MSRCPLCGAAMEGHFCSREGCALRALKNWKPTKEEAEAILGTRQEESK